MLEFLVKELIGMRKDMVQQPQQVYMPPFPPSGVHYDFDDGRRSVPVGQTGPFIPGQPHFYPQAQYSDQQRVGAQTVMHAPGRGQLDISPISQADDPRAALGKNLANQGSADDAFAR